MRVAYDEIVTQGVKRSLGVERVIGALLKTEIAAKPPSREGEVLIDIVKPVEKARPMQLISSLGPRQRKTCVYVESAPTAVRLR